MSGNHKITMKSVMTPFPYTIDIDKTLLDAKQEMAEHDIRHLPVAENGKLMGIISDRDIRWALDASLDLGEESEIPVRKIYRKDTYTVDLNTRLSTVLEHMHEHRIGSTLITKDNKLVGIFTTMDVCKVFAEHLSDGDSPQPEVA